MTTTPATKIIIVAGQEFSVPADTDNEAVRKQLQSMGFADVASATIQTGTREVGGETLTTVEFIKRAGTKGLDPADLAALISRVRPDLALACAGPTIEQVDLLARVHHGALSIGEALDLQQPIIAAFESLSRHTNYAEPGRLLCTRLSLPADAASVDVSGW